MACGLAYQKSSIKAAATNQTLQASSGILQLYSVRSTGCSIDMVNGNLALTKPGLYQVIFNGTTTGAGTNEISIQLYRNGIADQVGQASRTPSEAGSIESFGFSTIIEVTRARNSDGSIYIPLTLVNTGAAATYNDVSVTVVKLA